MNKYKIAGLILPIILWEVFAFVTDDVFIPSIFGEVLKAGFGINILSILYNSVYTLIKTLFVFVVANILGIALAYLCSLNIALSETVDFGIDFMRSIPVVAMFPIFLIAFGDGDISKVALVTFGIFLIVFFSTIKVMKTLSQAKMNIFLAQGADKFTIFIHYIRFILLQNFVSMAKITLSISLYITATLEMFIGSDYGIGKAIVSSKDYYNINEMYFWIILIGIIGYLLNKSASYLERRLVPS